MRIQVKGFSGFRAAMGNRKAVNLETKKAVSILECLQILGDRFGSGLRDLTFDSKTGHVRADILILVNGGHCRHEADWQNRLLKDGDELTLFPPVDGG
jgi:molybdopterin converting factor small subunit